MPSLVLFPRARVLLPKQRLRLRVHDIKISAALFDVANFAAFFSAGPGRISSIGVEATILRRYRAPHDRVDLEVIGGDRLQATGTGDGLVRDFEYIPDSDGPRDVGQLRAEVERAWQRFAAAAAESGRGMQLAAKIHDSPLIASYQLGTMLGISHPERQELLELPTTSERLERVLLILAGETGLLRHMLGLGRMGA